MNERASYAGRIFGRLTVISAAEQSRTGRPRELVRCSCGIERVVHRSALLSGDSRSCGCWKNELIAAANSTHGKTKTPEYKAWAGAVKRCEDENQKCFPNYGGRGIKVCERWRNSFPAFLEDMGARPTPKHSLDRIDVNGHYEPGNCRWATDKQQARNTRTNIIVTVDGITAIFAEHIERSGIQPQTVYKRMRMGWTRERALTEPIHKEWCREHNSQNV